VLLSAKATLQLSSLRNTAVAEPTTTPIMLARINHFKTLIKRIVSSAILRFMADLF